MDEVTAEDVDSVDLVSEGAEVMKIFLFVKFFKLVIEHLCFRHVTLDWQVVVVLFCDEIFEF